MPSFAQSAFLGALAALAIPVLIHLLSRWQVKRIEMGTTRFLREVITEAASQRRIRRWLLMLTRCSLLAVAAFLFARPYFTEQQHKDAGRLKIVMIDRSASMGMHGENGRLFDDALDSASKTLTKLGDEAEVWWAWFDRDVSLIDEGRVAPASPQVLVGNTNYFQALSWARDQAVRSEAIVEVDLYTDLQQTGFAKSDLDFGSLKFPESTSVRIIDVGRPAANNIAITNLYTGSTSLPPERPLNVKATVFNYGALPFEEVSTVATAKSGERTRRLRKTLNIPGEEAQELEFDFGALEPGRWDVTLDVDVEDDLMLDNRRRLAVNIAGPTDVLVITSKRSTDAERTASYYVQTALDQTLAVDGSPLMLKTASCSYDDTASLREQPTVTVVSDVSELKENNIAELNAYVQLGGRLLLLAGERISTTVAQQLNGSKLTPGKLRTRTTAGLSPFRIRTVSTRGAMLRPFHDPQHGDLGKLRFTTILPTELEEGPVVHAWFDTDRPAITEHSVGLGSVIWFLGSTDARTSNSTHSPLFLPLMHQMIAELLDLTGEGPVRLRTVGDTVVDADLDFVASENLELAAEANATNSAAEESDQESTNIRFETPGFFATDKATYVVNMSADESDISRGELDQLRDQYGLPPQEDQDAGEKKKRQVNIDRRREIWPWLAALAIALITFEFALANRTPA